MSLVGIDLGTTFSAIAYLDPSGRPTVVPLLDGPRLLPSLVYLEPGNEGRLRVGDIAAAQLGVSPERVAGGFKRFMGRPHEIRLGDQAFDPATLSSIVLKKLRQDFEHAVGSISAAVISVPAHFESEAREATLEAARLAGIPCERLINEPTAAVLSCVDALSLDGKVLVFDLGGGTFDVTIARVDGSAVEVLSSEGDLHLGGRDFDEKIVQLADQLFLSDLGTPMIPRGMAGQDRALFMRRYWGDAEELKKQLSRLTSASRTFVDVDARRSARLELSRHAFEQEISVYLSKASQLTDVVLENAGLSAGEVDHVVLVGGSCRIPAVQDRVRRMFGEARVHLAPNVDEAVCLGAAIRAGVLDGRGVGSGALRSAALVDVANKFYGTKTIDSGAGVLRNVIIIPKDTPIPCKESQVFYTVVDGQTKVDCEVTECAYAESDADLVPTKRRVELDLPPGRPAGQEIRVTYSYDENQVINCEFLDVASGRRASLDLDANEGSVRSLEFDIDDFVID